MHYTFLKELLSSPWQIDSHTFNTMHPIFTGLLNGITFEKEDQPANTIPYLVNATTQEIIAANIEYIGRDGNPDHEFVHVLPLRNVITKHDMECGPVGTRTLATWLRNVENDPSVIGHILLVESGGGQSSAVAELADAIQECKKPVVAYIDGMAASAAYYISSYANEIIASRKSDWVGCIGTMIEYQGRKKISGENSEGIVNVRVYASNATEKNEEYEEAINNGNVSLILDRILNPINDKFIADVRSNRPQVTAKQLKGRTFQASEVVGTLIDSIGTFETAVNRVLELANYDPNSRTKSRNNFNSNNKSALNMNPKLSALVALLAISNFEMVDGHATLNEEQLETISAQLDMLGQVQTQLLAAQAAQATAQTNLETANATIAQRDETITAHEATIAGLNNEPGTSGAPALTSSDDKPKTEGKPVAKGENISEDIENVANEYLK